MVSPPSEGEDEDGDLDAAPTWFTASSSQIEVVFLARASVRVSDR